MCQVGSEDDMDDIGIDMEKEKRKMGKQPVETEYEDEVKKISNQSKVNRAERRLQILNEIGKIRL